MTDVGSITPMPAPELIIPAHGEEMFPVRLKEWARLKEKISALKRHRRQWANLGWALIGIGASGVLSWLPYVLVDSTTDKAWVSTLTIVIGVAGLVGGALSLLFGHETQKSIDQAVHECKVHMHDMESLLTDEQRAQIAAFAEAVLE